MESVWENDPASLRLGRYIGMIELRRAARQRAGFGTRPLGRAGRGGTPSVSKVYFGISR